MKARNIMQFIVIAYDYTDEKAHDRLMAVRESHLKQAEEFFESGKWLYAVGIMDDHDKLIGSMIVCDFNSREEMQQQWLYDEPYITGKVWETITIHRALIPPMPKP